MERFVQAMADQFRRSITEHLARGRVDGGDQSGPVKFDDAVAAGLDDHPGPRFGGFQRRRAQLDQLFQLNAIGRQLFLCLTASGDDLANASIAGKAAGGVEDRHAAYR